MLDHPRRIPPPPSPVAWIARTLAAASAIALGACGSTNLSPPIETPTRSPRETGIEHLLTEVQGRSVTAWDRGAVLVVADSYATLPASYALPGLAASARAMHETLRDGCGVPDDAIKSLAGEQVIPQEIERAIRDFAERARGNATLVVFFTGHAIVDGDGQLQFFTRYTDKQDTTFANTLARTTLLRWLATARETAAARKVKLSTVLVADACRTPTLGTPPTAKLIREDTYEIYSTADGASADAPRGGATPFVQALAQTFAAGNPEATGSLRGVFQDLARRMADGGTKQTPQFIGPVESEGPRISQRNRVRVGLLVRDDLAATPLPLADAEVTVDKVPAEHDGELILLETSPDNAMRIEARVPGFLPFSRSVSFARRQNGKTFAIDLRPTFTRIVGRVSPAVSVQVMAGSDHVAPREGYHEMVAHTTSEDGAFQLRVPALGAGVVMQIVVQQNGRELKVLTVPVDKLEPDVQETGANRIDLGIVALDNADTSTLPAVVDLGALGDKRRAFDDDRLGGIKLPAVFDKPDYKNAPVLSDRFQEADWRAALAAIEADDLLSARQHLARLTSSMGRVDPIVRVIAGHIELSLALRSDDDAALVAAADRADKSDALLALGLRATLAARKLFRAAQMVQASDPRILDLLAEARALEPTPATPYGRTTQLRIRDLRWSIATKLLDNFNADGRHGDYVAAMQRLLTEDPDFQSATRDQRTVVALSQRLREALDLGRGRGEWLAADEAIALRRRVFVTDVPADLGDLEVEIARERISLETRNAWKAAEAARVSGDVDGATRLYETARAGANDHYRTLIDQRVAELREGVYNANLAQATRERAAGNLEGALLAYLRASAARGQMLPDVPDILRQQPTLAADPAVRNLHVALDQQCLAQARSARSPRAWQAYLDQFPNGEGAAEANAIVARAKAPWKAIATTPTDPALARFGQAMVYDEARGQVVMFGGAAANSDGSLRWLDDTWVWDGATWRRIDSPARPPARAFAAMAFDRDRGVVTLFGGSADTDKTGMDDTWLFDGVSWTRVGQVGPRPPARSEHAMAYDGKRARIVLYGGYKRHRDTWEWDGERWLVINSKDTPGTRLSAAMAFSPATGRVVLVGGDGRDRETWSWDGSNWTYTKGDVEQVDGGTLSAAGQRLLRFGGIGRAPVATLAAWADNAWRLLELGAAPPARAFHGAAYDPRRGVLVVHGGMIPGRRNRPERVFGDTWELWVE